MQIDFKISQRKNNNNKNFKLIATNTVILNIHYHFDPVYDTLVPYITNSDHKHLKGGGGGLV